MGFVGEVISAQKRTAGEAVRKREKTEVERVRLEEERELVLGQRLRRARGRSLLTAPGGSSAFTAGRTTLG